MAFAACGSDIAATASGSTTSNALSSDSSTESLTTESSAAESTPEDVLPAATFDGTAVTIAGEAFDLGDLADSDLVLWFWAPW